MRLKCSSHKGNNENITQYHHFYFLSKLPLESLDAKTKAGNMLFVKKKKEENLTVCFDICVFNMGNSAVMKVVQGNDTMHM